VAPSSWSRSDRRDAVPFTCDTQSDGKPRPAAGIEASHWPSSARSPSPSLCEILLDAPDALEHWSRFHPVACPFGQCRRGRWSPWTGLPARKLAPGAAGLRHVILTGRATRMPHRTVRAGCGRTTTVTVTTPMTSPCPLLLLERIPRMCLISANVPDKDEAGRFKSSQVHHGIDQHKRWSLCPEPAGLAGPRIKKPYLVTVPRGE
jgi:hypothetical protein